MNIPRQMGGKRHIYILSIFLLLLILIGLFFLSRPGIYIISDEAELFIYGKNRALWQTLKAAGSLLRPVYIITMPQSADVDLQLAYIEKSAPSVEVLIAPCRYQPVAEAFSQRHPQVAVAVWGYGSTSSLLNVFSVDYAADLRRVAQLTGPLASKTGLPPAIIFPLSFDVEYRNQLKLVFDEGLAAFGYTEGAVVLEKGYETGLSLSSVTLFPSDASLQSLSLPLVLFSSIRKDLLSKSVIAVFDDSLWPQIAAIVLSFKTKASRTIRFISAISSML